MLRVSKRTRIKKYAKHQWLVDLDNKLMSQSVADDTLPYRILAFIVLLICCMVAYLYMDSILEYFNSFLEWILQHPLKGAVVYIFIYGIAAVFMVPALLLSLGAGYIYASVYGTVLGITVAFFVDYIGATFGALLSFWLSRFLFYEWIEKWTKSYPKFIIAQKLLKLNAIKVILIIRVLMPYHIVNYLLGITTVTTYEYLVGCFGMVIPTFITCCIGSTITKISQLKGYLNSESSASMSFLKENVLITLLLIIVFIFLSYSIGKKAYDEFDKMKDELQRKEKTQRRNKHIISAVKYT